MKIDKFFPPSKSNFGFSFLLFLCVQIASVAEMPCGVKQELLRLEKKVYEWQDKIYAIQLDILDQEESLLKGQMKVIKLEHEGNCYTYRLPQAEVLILFHMRHETGMKGDMTQTC